jgi:pilus assembly protein CpaC
MGGGNGSNPSNMLPGTGPGIAQGSAPMDVTMPGAPVPLIGQAPGVGTTIGPVTPPPTLHVQGLTLEAGTGRIVTLDAPAASVFAVDPRVAEVRPASPTSLFVLGIAAGRTTIAAIGANGTAIDQYDVIVQPSSYPAAQAASAIARLLPGPTGW